MYWRFFGIHIVTGWACALLFSLGVTYILATSNPLLFFMSLMIPILDLFLSKRYIRQLEEARNEEEDGPLLIEDEPFLINKNRILILSVTGFGIGIFIHLITVLAVFT